MSERRTVDIKVYGKQYSIVSSEEPQITSEYAAYIDGVMREIAERTKSTDHNRVAVLALLKITHDLFTLRNQTRAYAEEFDQRMDQLLADINASMDMGGFQTEIVSDE